MNRIAFGFFAAVCGLVLIGAGTSARSTVTVKANVVADCSLQAAQDIDFGTYDPNSSTTIDVTTDALQIACTKGAPGVTIGLDNGQYYTGTHRAMRGGGTGAVYYEIYTAPERAIVWNRTQTVTYNSTSRQATKISLYGRVLGAASPSPGYYTDTVMAMVNF